MKIDYSANANEWCVYSHTIQNIVVFVGFCRIVDVLRARIPHSLKEWKKAVEAGYSDISVNIMTTHTNAQDAENMCNDVISVLNPRFNSASRIPGDAPPKIQCITTGDEFLTITEAANTLELPPTSISNHLAGRYGYSHVKGFRFKRL